MNTITIRRKHPALFNAIAFGAIVAIFLATITSAAELVAARIFSIDVKTGTVVGKETVTGRAFEFQVKDVVLLRSLKAGQKFSADLTAVTALLPSAKPGATTVPIRILKAEPVGAQSAPATGISSSVSSASDELKVFFTCPTEARIKTFTPEKAMNGPYTEDPGDGGSVELIYRAGGIAGWPAYGHFDGASTDGQFIYCAYRHADLRWKYDYRINRTVIGCSTSNRQINCRLHP